MKYASMMNLRDRYEKLDKAVSRYEDYCEENGIPYCDYRLNRLHHLEATPLEKFRSGVRRIIRILKSYKSNALTDLLGKVHEQVKKKKGKREQKRKELLLKTTPLTTEQRNEQSMVILTQKVEELKDIILDQKDEIDSLKGNLMTILLRIEANQNNGNRFGSNNDEIKLGNLESIKSLKKNRDVVMNVQEEESSLEETYK